MMLTPTQRKRKGQRGTPRQVVDFTSSSPVLARQSPSFAISVLKISPALMLRISRSTALRSFALFPATLFRHRLRKGKTRLAGNPNLRTGGGLSYVFAPHARARTHTHTHTHNNTVYHRLWIRIYPLHFFVGAHTVVLSLSLSLSLSLPLSSPQTHACIHRGEA
jgi:hypothetical protein